MQILTVLEMSKVLGITSDGVKKRLKKAGISPKSYIGPTAVYEETALLAIKDVLRGQPSHAPKGKPKAKADSTPKTVKKITKKK
jgi:hypothetical protein